MRVFLCATLAAVCLTLCGCEGDYQRSARVAHGRVKGAGDTGPQPADGPRCRCEAAGGGRRRAPAAWELPKVEVDAFKTPGKGSTAGAFGGALLGRPLAGCKGHRECHCNRESYSDDPDERRRLLWTHTTSVAQSRLHGGTPVLVLQCRHQTRCQVTKRAANNDISGA